MRVRTCVHVHMCMCVHTRVHHGKTAHSHMLPSLACPLASLRKQVIWTERRPTPQTDADASPAKFPVHSRWIKGGEVLSLWVLVGGRPQISGGAPSEGSSRDRVGDLGRVWPLRPGSPRDASATPAPLLQASTSWPD